MSLWQWHQILPRVRRDRDRVVMTSLTADQARIVFDALEYPSNGWALCRWCHLSVQEHATQCGYVDLCRRVDAAREILRPFLAREAV